MNVVNAEQMRQADAHAIQDLGIPSLTLMENAATAVCHVVFKRYPQERLTVVVCGKGNNGGDGLAVARILKTRGWNPTVLLLARSSELRADPAANWKEAQNAGVVCYETTNLANIEAPLAGAELIIDAIFGTGLSKPLESFYSQVVQLINRSGKEVISIDVPSGLSSDTGELLGPAIRAHTTVALASLKYCHVLSPACRMCGDTYVADIGIPVDATTKLVTSQDVRRVLPHRKPDSHKGTFGHAVIIAGSTGKSGAAYMAGKAALRAGAGLVTVSSPGAVQPVIAALGPEIMTHPAQGKEDYFTPEAIADLSEFLSDKSAVAIGPGIGTDDLTSEFFHQIVPRFHGAMLIDADGLNLVARKIETLKEREALSTVLTPHPGEMARLLGVQTPEIQRDRIGAARELSHRTNAIAVLKGYRTIIAEPGGHVWINITGGQPLASAGTGDILTGIITGFMAQKLTPLEAAQAGVFLHGFVANLFEAQFPQQALNAMDILSYWNRAVHAVRTAEDVEGEHLHVHFGV